ncbi:MAG: PAS-domain containing protein [Paracoccaceae bacterium]|nr:PAS-domain containing protein [Paracoccaceae bacterium]
MAARKKKIRLGSHDDIEGLARLPDESNSPVMRIDPEGVVIYANKYSRTMSKLLNADTLAVDNLISRTALECYQSNEQGRVDFAAGEIIFELAIIPVHEFEYVNIYGRDVTQMREAQKQAADLNKFPNENPNPVMRSLADGTLLFCNHASELLPGVVEQAPHMRLTTLLANTANESMRTRDITTVTLETGEQTFLFMYTPVAGEDYVNIYGREISSEIEAQNALVTANAQLERRVAERTASVRLLQNIVLAANSAESFEGAMQTAIHEICNYANWPVGHAYVVDHSNGRGELIPSGIWHIETASKLSDLGAATENLRFGDVSGLPGRVLAEGREVWIENLATYDDFRRAEFTKQAGLKAGMAFPITINSQVIGVLEFFSQEITPANIEIVKTLEHVGAQLGSVSERKTAEAEVKKSREEAELAHSRMTDALEVIGQGFVLFDKDDNIALFNSKYAERTKKILGRDPLVGDNFEAIMRASAEVNYIPDSMEDKEHWVRRILDERRETKTRDSISKQNDGTWFRAEGYETSDGGTVSIFTDVTELKEKEEELAEMARQSELAHARLHDGIQALGQGFALFDQEDRFVMFNQKYSDMIEVLARKPIVGERFADILKTVKRTDYNGLTRDQWMKNVLEERQSDEARDSTNRLPDGTWYKAEGFRTRDGGNVSVFTDITELKEHEETLNKLAEESELAHSRLLDAVEAIGQGFVLFDADDRFVLFNKMYLDVARAIGHDPKPGDHFESIVRNTKKTDFGDKTRDEWIEGILSDRRENPTRSSTALLDGKWFKSEGYQTGEGGIVSTFTDITELKEHEKELDGLVKELGVARDSAVDANSAKSQFLANMSHELRTPLNAIIGYAELLIDDAEDDENEDYIPDLEKIQSAGKHLLGLINDILDLSKIEVGKIELYIEEISVVDMLEDVSNTIKPLVDKNHNTLVIEMGKGVDTIQSDLTKLRQNMFNLLSNAAKFTENGTLRIDTSIEPSPNGDLIVFDISDEGIGMTPEQLEKIFDPFTQADSSTSKKFGGTGLGLTITREFSRMLGGDILAVSTPDVGTTFTMKVAVDGTSIVALPEVDEPRNANAAEISEDSPLVLIIDDDANVRELLHRNLNVAGYRTEMAVHGKEGLKKAKELLPDAITLDVIMPHTDGWSVLSQLKSDKATANIPVVMVTIAEDRSLGFSLGAAEYLSKPVDRKKLVQVLDKFLLNKASSAVLLVEDDEPTRTVMRKYLENEGASVIEATNGREGIEALEKTTPSMILLDLMMPEMDGFGFVEEYRKRPEWHDIPIVVVTAKTLTADEKRKLEGWVDALYNKLESSVDDVLCDIQAKLKKS